MRKYMQLVEGYIAEVYSPENSSLLRYMRDGGFDPHGEAWFWICKWIKQNDALDELNEKFGTDYTDSDDLSDRGDPEMFHGLSDHDRQECKDYVIRMFMKHEPENAPTTMHMSLSRDKLLPRTTWLVHFTDEPYGIVERGFRYGTDRMDQLGLTLWMGKDSKKYGGYNFAFLAGSRDAISCASKSRSASDYGKHAVLFQNSGVAAYHAGDNENQVIFHGPDVNPNDIIALTYENEDWQVRSRSEDILFTGSYGKSVAWVIQNQAQYRRQLSGR